MWLKSLDSLRSPRILAAARNTGEPKRPASPAEPNTIRLAGSQPAPQGWLKHFPWHQESKVPNQIFPKLRLPLSPILAAARAAGLFSAPARQRYREHHVVVRSFAPRSILFVSRGGHFHPHLGHL